MLCKGKNNAVFNCFIGISELLDTRVLMKKRVLIKHWHVLNYAPKGFAVPVITQLSTMAHKVMVISVMMQFLYK